MIDIENWWALIISWYIDHGDHKSEIWSSVDQLRAIPTLGHQGMEARLLELRQNLFCMGNQCPPLDLDFLKGLLHLWLDIPVLSIEKTPLMNGLNPIITKSIN